MKKYRYEIITFFIILILSAVVVEWKKDQVRESRGKEVESVLGLLISEGAPVHTLILEPQTFFIEKMVTLETCQKNLLCANISENEKSHIRAGQKILKAKNDKEVGQVLSVGSRRNFNNGLFEVKVRPSQTLKQNKIASKIVTKIIPGSISIPNASVILEEDGFYVWKVNDDNVTATKTKIEVGHKNSSLVEITKGLQEGDQIVFRGAAQVSKYKKIRIMDTKKSSEINISAI